MREDIRSQLKGSLIERLATLGTQGWYGQDRLGLIVANVTGYLAAVSSLIFAATYAAHEYSSLKPLVWGKYGDAMGHAAKYTVYETREGWAAVCYPFEKPHYRIGEFGCEQAAKAAVDDHNEACIREALE